MKKNKQLCLKLLLSLCLGLSYSSSIYAQTNTEANNATNTTAESTQNTQFSEAQLQQLVAPIALYPDALLAQVMIASTYPLEVIEASRFMEKNPNLKDEALDTALANQKWSVSVKGLCYAPDVLTLMSDNLEWLQALGDAYLEQPKEIMLAVQTMRTAAINAGTLKTDEYIKVDTQEASSENSSSSSSTVIIESTNPDVVYVPTYSPSNIYGSYWDSTDVIYYPGIYNQPNYDPILSFGAGMLIGGIIGANVNWGHDYGNIYFNDRRPGYHYNHWGDTDIEINTNRPWQHDPIHRGNVHYKSPKLNQKFNNAKRNTNIQVNKNNQVKIHPKKNIADKKITKPKVTNHKNAPKVTKPKKRVNDTGLNRVNKKAPHSFSNKAEFEHKSSLRGAKSTHTRSALPNKRQTPSHRGGGARRGGGNRLR